MSCKKSSIDVTTIVHFDAGHDHNGNPRRCYVAFAQCDIVEAWGEGYRGVNAVPVELRTLAREAATFDITPRCYRETLRLWETKP